MKNLPNIIGALLGLAFIAFASMFFLNLMPAQSAPPEGSPIALFMGALIPSGYMAFVKSCELIGGILTAVPRTRNIGLLFLGPVLLNIIAFHYFLTKGDGLRDPVLVGLCLMASYLLWHGRKKFAGLLN